MEIVAQILGILGMISFILSFQFKKASHIILFQLLGSLSYTLQYVCFSIISGYLYMGLFMNAIGVFRGVVYYKSELFYANSKWWIYGFFISYFLCYALLFIVFNMPSTPYNIIIEFLPILGMIITQLSYRHKSAKKIRIYGIFSCIPWGLYHGFHLSIGGIIGEAINLLSTIIGIFRHDIKKIEIE